MTRSRKLILFDFDGTLVASLPGITACMQEALSGFGFPRPGEEAVRATIGLTLEESIRRLTDFQCEAAMLPEVVRAYRDLHNSQAAPRTKVFDGAIELLKQMKRCNTLTALVSNKGTAGLHQLLQQLEMNTYFDLVLSAENVTVRKPSAELYTRHIAPCFPSITRSETLVVGDTEADIQFAQNSEIDCCWAEYGYGDRQACEALLPEFKISSLTELARVV